MTATKFVWRGLYVWALALAVTIGWSAPVVSAAQEKKE